MNLKLRPINSTDVAIVADLHAASWRSAYRGILQDSFLDGDLLSNRRALWTERLASLSSSHFGFIATQDDKPMGFTFAYGIEDAQWGTLVDNLHVFPRAKGKGIGRALLAEVCKVAHARWPMAGVHLWVFEKNVAAKKFYERLGCHLAERVLADAPGGGQEMEWCCVWKSTAELLKKLEIAQT